jgi:DHA1 family bicyclomycin/chloramphenicol resistance-like MFS transporter
VNALPLTSPPPAAAAVTAPAEGARLGATLAGVAIALLMGLQALTTDLYLPALPLLTRELGATVTAAQLTMSALLLAFGLGQLLWGPLSDRHGRRPVLLAGLSLYLLASLGAALAGSIGLLIVLRMAQGLTVAAAVVVARAMVRDLYEPAQGAQVMARALSGLGLIAIASPIVGGIVTATLGWRCAFVAVACGGAAVLALVGLRLPETLAPERRSRPARRATTSVTGNEPPSAPHHPWIEVLRHPGFRAWTLMTCCSYGGLFVFLASSSFVYIGVLGLSPLEYGAVAATCSFSYLAGTLFCRRRLARLGVAVSVQQAAGLSGLAALGFAVPALLGVHSLAAVWLPQLVYQFAHGTHMPCCQVGAVAPFPHQAGLASALSGCATALVAMLISLGLGQILDHSTHALAGGSALFAALSCLCAWTLVRRHGSVERATTASVRAASPASA